MEFLLLRCLVFHDVCPSYVVCVSTRLFTARRSCSTPLQDLTRLIQETEEGFCRGRESGIFASDNTKLPLDLEVADRHDAEPSILRLRRHRQA